VALGTFGIVRNIHKSPIAWLSLILGIVVAIGLWPTDTPAANQVSFTEFDRLLDEGRLVTVELIEGENRLLAETDDGRELETRFFGQGGENLLRELNDAGVELTVSRPEGPNQWMSLLMTVVPYLVMGLVVFGIFWYFMKMRGGAGGFGKARAQKVTKDHPHVTFADVAGCGEAIEELKEIKEFLQDPTRFYAMGARIPKGVLLYGPPGTGKTLLARAVAGEAGVPFFSISGSDFVEMFVGVGASRVRDLFAQAKAEGAAIIFIDEIDAVGRHRGAGVGGGHDEREQTLNQLLVEMDGFDATTGVIMIAASNRPDILDPALLRPGRFDRQILVDKPDLEGRKAILKVHSARKPLDLTLDIDTIAKRTPGFTGADLANLMNEAALLSARRRKMVIGPEELEDAIDRVMAGAERKSLVLAERERRMIAYHEAGHALVGHVLQHTDPIHKVSIISRGRALGWTLALPEQDRYLRTRSQLRDDLAMLLGGRASEEMVFGDPTTGAADDIERVTALARSMVTEFGMSEALGPQRYAGRDGEVFLGRDIASPQAHSTGVATRIDEEISRLIDLARTEAVAILEHHRATLHTLAQELLEHETLNREDLERIFAGLDTWQRAESIDVSLMAPLLPGGAGDAAGVGADYRANAGRYPDSGAAIAG
jgi:cell division protease FtsH